MWIKTQDGSLINANSFRIVKDISPANGYYIETEMGNAAWYETKERAQKVMDQIENLLSEDYVIGNLPQYNSKFITPKCFTMPQDNEI